MSLHIGDKIKYEGSTWVVLELGEFYAAVANSNTNLKHIVPTHKLGWVEIEFEKIYD